MIDDPIVQEIQEIRRRLWEECGGDLDRYLERLQSGEAEQQDRLVTMEEVEKRAAAAAGLPAKAETSNE